MARLTRTLSRLGRGPRGRAARLLGELSAFRTVADFTYDWEIWFGPDGRAGYVSPSCRRITGFDPRDVREDPLFFHKAIHPEDLPRWSEAMRQAETGAAPSVDFRFTRAGGQLIWLAQETTRVTGPDGAYRGLRLSLRDVTERVLAQAALREARSRLEERVRERTRELELSRERYRALSGYLRDSVERERARIARELHDELGQNLTALNMGLHRLEKGAALSDPEAAARIAALKALTADTLESVRRITRELRPPILDELGLSDAVAWSARSFQESTGVAVRLTRGRVPDLPPEAATALYRVLQEALTNVARHARASRVSVRLGASRGELVLRVSDDGQGITAAQLDSPDSFGIIGMRERVRAAGGSMDIRPGARGGTEVSVRLPVPARRGAAS